MSVCLLLSHYYYLSFLLYITEGNIPLQGSSLLLCLFRRLVGGHRFISVFLVKEGVGLGIQNCQSLATSD